MYGIFRFEKVSGSQKLRNYQLEHERKEDDKNKFKTIGDNINWNYTKYNEAVIKQDLSYNIAFKHQVQKRMPDKTIRKDCVRAIDSFMTATPEWFDMHVTGIRPDGSRIYDDTVKQYFTDCKDWYIKTFCQGDESRVLGCQIHYDEETPHIHLQSIPFFEKIERDDKGNIIGKTMTLSAKSILKGGGRSVISALQTDFFKSVTEKYGFERGVYKKDSKSFHVSHHNAPKDTTLNAPQMYTSEELKEDIQQEPITSLDEMLKASRESIKPKNIPSVAERRDEIAEKYARKDSANSSIAVGDALDALFVDTPKTLDDAKKKGYFVGL